MTICTAGEGELLPFLTDFPGCLSTCCKISLLIL